MPSSPLRRMIGLVKRAALAAALGWLASVPLAGTAAAAASDSLTVTITPKDVWPPAPVADLAAAPGAEGQMLLTWTAPDSNNNQLPGLSASAGYQIRIATFSVGMVGASTTTWWTYAKDVRALTSPAVAVDPPTPAFPGVSQSLLLQGLEPGVTYYAMIISSDTAGLYSDSDVPSRTPNGQANALVYDAQPPAPTNLQVVQIGTAVFSVSWTSPTAYDLAHYKLYMDSSTPLDFGNAQVFQISSNSTSMLIGGLSTGTYVFRITAVDKGAPADKGIMLESVSASTVTVELFGNIRRPQTPFGISVSSAMGVQLRWLPVERFENGAPFVDPANAAVDELSGYRVYRSTSIVYGGWSHLITLSSSTLTWTDLAGGPQHYYHIRSENSTAVSERSVLRSLGTRSAYVLAPDDASYFEILASDVKPIEGVAAASDSAYLVQASSRPEDLGGRVVKSLEFKAWKGGMQLEPDFEIEGLGWLRLRYALSSGTFVSPASFAAGVNPTPDNMSVYWFNGRAWVQLYGKNDALNQTMVVQAKYFGRYQLRTVERVGSFNFNQAGLSNRLVTPNGDGKNDNVEFRFDNPRDSQVTLRILDLRGKVVASDVSEAGSTGGMTSRVWRPGASVPGGVYIYQIEAEGKTFTGTLVIIK